MGYIGKLVAYDPGLSRLSYDRSPWLCGVEGCTNFINHMLTVPGEYIGKPGRTYHLLRCLNCMFGDVCYSYYDALDRLIRVQQDLVEGDCHHFLEGCDVSKAASILWTPREGDPDELGFCTRAGGQPGDPFEANVANMNGLACPVCKEDMEFVLQIYSGDLDSSQNPDMSYEFSLWIEHYATLFMFDCPKCRVWASFSYNT